MKKSELKQLIKEEITKVLESFPAKKYKNQYLNNNL